MILIFLGIFGIGLVVYHIWTRQSEVDGAPFVPMDPDVALRILSMAGVGKGDIFYDLGSGDGRLVIAAALKGAESYGIETDWLRVLYSRFWIKLLHLEKHAKIVHGDIFKYDLSKATVIHTYLLQETNNRLEEKLDKEVKKGTRIISAAFSYAKWKRIQTDPRGTPYGPLYLYKV